MNLTSSPIPISCAKNVLGVLTFKISPAISSELHPHSLRILVVGKVIKEPIVQSLPHMNCTPSLA